MTNESFEFFDKSSSGKIKYEPPTLTTLDQDFGIIVMGGSNIIYDEEHEYAPDND